METRQAFPERIADERKNAGLTQDELASQLGISRQSITLYEKGARVPDIEVLRKFADFFDVTADYLLGITDNRTSESEIIGDMLGLDDFQINFLKQKTEWRAIWYKYMNASHPHTGETEEDKETRQEQRKLFSQELEKKIKVDTNKSHPEFHGANLFLWLSEGFNLVVDDEKFLVLLGKYLCGDYFMFVDDGFTAEQRDGLSLLELQGYLMQKQKLVRKAQEEE